MVCFQECQLLLLRTVMAMRLPAVSTGTVVAGESDSSEGEATKAGADTLL